MADSIEHRGPDDDGYYLSGPVGLGFRRLAIIDLNTGHQPISNEDGTVWIVFNGEIYNYQELRRMLVAKGHVFRSQTDTEVIVHLYEEFGEACVEQLRGMFGFAIWDDRQKTLFIARDRVGIKPIYYWASDECLVFGSEIKAILADPSVRPEVQSEMIDRFLAFYYLPGEETLFRNIYKLAPGHCMTVKDGRIRIRQYWDLRFAVRQRSLRQAEQELVHLLEESVQLHMISDVPVGFLLSGGVDSTAMLGFAVGKTDKALKSFTLGFSSPDVVDERPYARLAAQRYGSEHHEMTISSHEFADFLPRYAWYMEEPVCEPTAIALYYVTRMAREHVKVLISGEGGDEAFAGYPNYRNMLLLERVKRAAGPLSGALSSALWGLNRVAPNGRVQKYAYLMGTPFNSYYYSRISGPGTYFNRFGSEFYTAEFAGQINKATSVRPATRYLDGDGAQCSVNRMLYVDTKTALPDDLLLKADKMTMSNSLELRVPLLDHQLLEFAATLPENFKVRGLVTKFIAKRALRSRVPHEILDRKKVGFPVPFGNWLRTELSGYVNDVLLDSRTVTRGYFKRRSIENLIQKHAVSGGYSKEILSLLSLELWHRAFLNNDRQPAAAPAMAR
jgi:asparagine synthase (glutamine-hydrolysing)